MMHQPRDNKLFYIIFTLSGFTGLIYESIWTQYLKLFMGHAAYAQAMVLSIFMGGMAIGAWLCSRYTNRLTQPLLAYALTEAVIGIFAICFHNGFVELTLLAQTRIFPLIGDPDFVRLLKWTIALLMILPQSIMLGMTFPLMSCGMVRRKNDDQGKVLASLYFFNSTGAAIGVLVCGFVLIKLLGLPGSMIMAGILNLLIALLVYQKNSSSKQETTSPLESDSTLLHTKPILNKSGIMLLMVSLFTGIASFIYEIGWIRMLSLLLGSSTHSLELMLSAFIIGLALGSLWLRGRMTNIDKPWRFLACVQVIMGSCACLTIFFYMPLFDVMAWLIQHLAHNEQGYLLFNLSSHSMAMLLMLPATFCAGMTLPLITAILLRTEYGESSIGAVYGANTLGAIIGVIFALFVGLPYLGIKGLILSGAALDMVLGVILLLHYYSSWQESRTPLTITATGVVLLLLCWNFTYFDPYKLASGIFRDGKFLLPGSDVILFHEDGKTATISVVNHSNNFVSIRTNGKSDSAMSTNTTRGADESTMFLAAFLPMLYNPNASNAAVIGLGTGATSATLLDYEQLISVDTIEIEEKIVKGANFFRPPVERVYSDPRSHIIIDDAKTYFSTYNRKYDILISEPSNPWVSGISGLFSVEFYSLAKRHLTRNGLFVQWLQLYEIDDQSVISVLKALDQSFCDYAIYSPCKSDLLIVASPVRLLPDLTDNDIGNTTIRNELSRLGISRLTDIKQRFVARKSAISGTLSANNIPHNSDYYPFLDQNAAKARYLKKNGLKTLFAIQNEPKLLSRITR